MPLRGPRSSGPRDGEGDLDADMGRGTRDADMGCRAWDMDMDMNMDMGCGHGHGYGTWTGTWDMDVGRGLGWTWTWTWTGRQGAVLWRHGLRAGDQVCTVVVVDVEEVVDEVVWDSETGAVARADVSKAHLS